MIAAVCGDCVVWKPSSQTPLCAIAVQKICNRVFERHGVKSVFNLVIGREVGERMLDDRRLPLISFTGSSQVGVHVAEVVGRRLGRTILEHSRNGSLPNSERLRYARCPGGEGGAAGFSAGCHRGRRPRRPADRPGIVV